MKKLKTYKQILDCTLRAIVVNDPSVIQESRLAKRLNIKKQKIKRSNV